MPITCVCYLYVKTVDMYMYILYKAVILAAADGVVKPLAGTTYNNHR